MRNEEYSILKSFALLEKTPGVPGLNLPGLDIASIAHKRLANQIILIAGDSDFVPAAKQARREGIDFVLDRL